MLRERLPRYMMPHRIVIVDDIPLTNNGKPDDTVLRARHTGPPHLAAPQTETEKLLAQVLLELLESCQLLLLCCLLRCRQALFGLLRCGSGLGL